MEQLSITHTPTRVEAWQIDPDTDLINGLSIVSWGTTCMNEWIEYGGSLSDGSIVRYGYYTPVNINRIDKEN